MSDAEPDVQVHQVEGWRRVALLPLGLAVRAWCASLHFRIHPEDLAAVTSQAPASAFVLWHNRLFIIAEIHRRYRSGHPVYGLVSASKDGAWLAAFFSLVGIRAVRGSSSKGGREALFALTGVLRAGNDIGITPDGPRGPLYDFKAGCLLVARRAHVPMLVLGAAFERAWRVRSWDRFALPLPFSTVHIRCVRVGPDDARVRTDAAAQLSGLLRRINPDDTPGPEHDPGV